MNTNFIDRFNNFQDQLYKNVIDNNSINLLYLIVNVFILFVIKCLENKDIYIFTEKLGYTFDINSQNLFYLDFIILCFFSFVILNIFSLFQYIGYTLFNIKIKYRYLFNVNMFCLLIINSIKLMNLLFFDVYNLFVLLLILFLVFIFFPLSLIMIIKILSKITNTNKSISIMIFLFSFLFYIAARVGLMILYYFLLLTF